MACILCVDSPLVGGMELEQEVASEVEQSAVVIVELILKPAPPSNAVLNQKLFLLG